MHMIDLAPYTGILIILLLIVSFVAILSIVDTTYVAPHAVLRSVHCGRYGRNTQVEFTEQVQTGLEIRTVRSCPLRHEGERCGEACIWAPPPESPA